MQHKTFSAFSFSDEAIDFDIKQYSVFKHGSKVAAKKMAMELFVKYAPEIPNTSKEFIVFPSPYHFIPSACSLIKDEFLLLLNRWLVANGRLPAVESNIHRRLSYHSDYGKMSEQERAILINGDKFYIDKEYIKDKFCLFLDDVRITGSHEKVLTKLIPEDVDFQVIYYAQYEGNEATIESYLNSNYIKTSASLIPLILGNDFVFNVRNIRLIITQSELEFESYIRAVSSLHASFNNDNSSWAQELYDWCIGNHYHLVPIYKRNIELLAEHVKTN